MPGPKPFGPGVPSRTGRTLSGPMWLSTARCLLACSLCWRFGIITELLLFELSSHDRCVRTFQHTGTNRPTFAQEAWSVPECLLLAQIHQRFFHGCAGQRRGLKLREQPERGTGASILEHVQTLLSSMREVSHPHGVRSVDAHSHCLQPGSTIGDRTDRCRLKHLLA